MKQYFLIAILLIFTNLLAFSSDKDKSTKEKIVLIKTELGDIKIKLYNETPLHRDNFIKLVEDKYYDDLLFHRVIKNFMIQTGDPNSKNAADGIMLGDGGPSYTIPAEIVSPLYHKRGAIAAARQGDDINPNKESSGSQFYIVQGSVFTNEQLERMQEKIRHDKKKEIFTKYLNAPENAALKKEIDSLKTQKQIIAMNEKIKVVGKILKPQYDKCDEFVLSPEQIATYTTIGGAPHLDGGYTVFGEVIEGMDVVDKIAEAEGDKYNRPLKNIKIISVKILK